MLSVILNGWTKQSEKATLCLKCSLTVTVRILKKTNERAKQKIKKKNSWISPFWRARIFIKPQGVPFSLSAPIIADRRRGGSEFLNSLFS